MGASTPACENFVAQGGRREFRLPAGLLSNPALHTSRIMITSRRRIRR